MNEKSRFSEHYRIDQYLKKRSIKVLKSHTIKKSSNQLSNFPIGLIIITNEGLKYEDKLEFINQYACKLFQVKENVDINILKQKFSEYIKLKNNYITKTSQSLNDIIFNSSSSFNLEMDNFIPFESTHSKTSILYIKINDIDNEKYIVIDKYDKYIEERKYIEFNLIKTINYQYLHTLYHELNNPLNALLALSGENQRFEQTEIGGSRIYDKNSIIQKRSMKKKGKKEKKAGLLSLNSSKNKILFQEIKDDNKSRKKSIDEGHFEVNSRISLLINIIKVFIKNFILYLKTKADSLVQLKNEYELQNDTSDIMNAVEVSDYERELTRHKNVKINLEYILELYFEKYLCLYKYKEIDYDTNFEKLRNLFILTDEFNFSYYIRQIYTYLYYVVPKKDGFYFEYILESDKVKIMIKKKSYENLSRRTDNNYRISLIDGHGFKMDQVIQTKEMTKEVLYAMSKKLKFNIEIFDCDGIEQNNYLNIILPIENYEQTEDNDDFKDEDINEMVGKDAIVLEEKLRRQLPNVSFLEGQKQSNISTIQNMDILNKSGEDMKWSLDSFTSINKTNILNHNFKNKNFIINSRSSDNNINLTESQKKIDSFKNNSIKNNSNNSFLNKCKATDPKKSEKSKFKINTDSESDILLNNDKKHNNIRSVSSVEIKIKNNDDEKKEINKFKTQKLKKQSDKGIFTLINSKGSPDDINYEYNPLIEIPIDLTKNKKDIMTFKEQSASGYASSIKGKIINENKPINNQLNNEKMGSGTQNSTTGKTSFFGKKNASKIKSSFFLSELNYNDNDDKNEELERNGLVLIELEKDKKWSLKKMNEKKSSKIFLDTIKEETDKKQKSSQNIMPISSNKNSSDDEKIQKDNYNKTIVDNVIDDNETLFLKAIQESKMHIEKTKQKNNKYNSDNYSNNKFQSESGESDCLFDSDSQCNCADILVVDDEEFNVMASQRMLQKLGYESDAAYNGEECINLINEKIKLNCKCKCSYYKLIFLDIVMPIMDGIKTAEEIQSMIDKKIINNQTKIIFISGNIDGSNLKNSLLEIDCVKECLQKPVQITKYQKIIEKYYNCN